MNQRMILHEPPQRQAPRVMHRALRAGLSPYAARALRHALESAEVEDGCAVTIVTSTELATRMGVTPRHVRRYVKELRDAGLDWLSVSPGQWGYAISVTPDVPRTYPGPTQDIPRTYPGHGEESDPGHTPDAPRTCDDETPISQEHSLHSPLRGEGVSVPQPTDLHSLPLSDLIVMLVKERAGIEVNVFELEAVVCSLATTLEESERLAYLTDTVNRWADGNEGRGYSRKALCGMLRNNLDQWRADEERDRQVRQRGQVEQPAAPVTRASLGFDAAPEVPEQPRVKSLDERIGKIARKIEKLSPHAWATTLTAIADAKKMADLDAAEQLVRDAYKADLEARSARMARRAS